MRTTISLDPDVAAEVRRLRRDRGFGLSEAINELVRAGMAAPKERTQMTFRQRSVDLGLRIDVTNVAEALDVLEGPAAR